MSQRAQNWLTPGFRGTDGRWQRQFIEMKGGLQENYSRPGPQTVSKATASEPGTIVTGYQAAAAFNARPGHTPFQSAAPLWVSNWMPAQVERLSPAAPVGAVFRAESATKAKGNRRMR